MNRPHHLSRFAVIATLGALALSLAGCAALSRPTPIPNRPDGGQRPPSVVVRAGGQALELDAWTFCWTSQRQGQRQSLCADGMPPNDPPDIGAPPRVEITFPLPAWTFHAEFTTADDECARTFPAEVVRIGDTTWTLEPAGPPGTYDVTLSGFGKEGDLFVTFSWETPQQGPIPAPAGRLAVLADHDGVVDSYGVELALSDLAATPETAEAEVTVTAANGRSLTFEATRGPEEECFAAGSVYWDGPDAAGLEAAGLGPGPFTYRVVVTLDGTEHVATATWPDDVIPDNEPSVGLEFNPPLPAFAPTH
jgi:hypothetical protein